MVGEGVWRQGGKDEYCFLFCPKWIKINFSCRALLLHVFTFCPLWQASMHANKFFANTLPFSSHSGGVCSCFFANTAVVFPPIAGVPVVVVLILFCKYCYHSSSGVGLLLVSCFWQMLVSFSSHCGVACCCCWKYPGTHFAAALFLEEERQIVRQAKNLPSPLSRSSLSVNTIVS